MKSSTRSLATAVAIALVAMVSAPSHAAPPEATELTLAGAAPAELSADSSCLPAKCADADFDGSGTLTPADLAQWLEYFFNGLPDGDLNGDGFTGAADLSLWLCLFFTC